MAAAALTAGPATAGTPAKDWKEIAKPALRPFVPTQPRRVALGNGMVIFLQEDRELPLIQMTLMVRGGYRDEDAAKRGLVNIYGQAWRTGGTAKRTGDDLDDFLEARGADVETGGGLASTTLGISCLKQNFDEVWDVALELLQHPEFRSEKIDLAKRQLAAIIARRNNNVDSIVARESDKLGYGADSPYARHPEFSTVAAVTRDDLLAWHKAHVHPNNMLLGIVGDFDTKVMEAKLRKAFESWPRGPAVAPAPREVPPGAKPGYYFIQKDDVNQSNIAMVHLGITRDNPDYYAVVVMNEVLGGAFVGRLFMNVRSKKGLAYGVGGGVGGGWDHPGLFSIMTSTKSGSTAAAIDALYEEIDNIKKVPPTADELQRAKDSILNSFIFRFDSRDKILDEKMTYEFYGYPLDRLEHFRAAVEKVTIDDVSRVAGKYIDKSKLAVLVVGKAADFDRPLTSFGEVMPIDITIPPPPGPPPAAAH
jgi:zinc protease